MPPLAIDCIPDWPARLRGLLYEQFKQDPFFVGLCNDVLGPQVQALEDSAQSLIPWMAKSVDFSEVVQLDKIGILVGQARGGDADPTYRIHLRARMRANLSEGTFADLYAVTRALFGTTPTIKITPSYPAALSIHVAGVAITDAQAAAAYEILRFAATAGVRIIFEWQSASDADAFTMEIAAILTNVANPGDIVLTVDDTSAFPAAGTLNLGDPTLMFWEVVTYTGKTPTSFFGIAPPVANVHIAGGEVSIKIPASPGKGFGDATDPTVGGKLSGAT